MAGTTRTRKTAASKPAAGNAAAAEAPAEAEIVTDTEDHAPVEGHAPQAPDAAPLEPPAAQEPPKPPAAPAYATPTEVIPDDDNLSEIIIDDVTKQPPADVDAVFRPLTEYGSVLVCTIRLVEKTFLGPHRNPVHRLLQPAGAHVSENVASRIRERLQAQATRLASMAAEQ